MRIKSQSDPTHTSYTHVKLDARKLMEDVLAVYAVRDCHQSLFTTGCHRDWCYDRIVRQAYTEIATSIKLVAP